jgi:hypothetical protein
MNFADTRNTPQPRHHLASTSEGETGTTHSVEFRISRVDTICELTANTVVQKVTHGTVVQNLHPEGSIGFGLGLDLDFSSLSHSSGVRGAPHPMQEEGERKTEAKPENLKPTPEPKPTPKPKPAKVRYAPDGTRWPEGFDSWMNARRLRWLEVHGWEQGRMAESSPQKTSKVVGKDGKPTATATPLHDPPSSAAPPIPDCVRCDKPCTIQQGEWVCYACNLRQPVEQPPELDNWDEL